MRFGLHWRMLDDMKRNNAKIGKCLLDKVHFWFGVDLPTYLRI
jgi:hypothetical protein